MNVFGCYYCCSYVNSCFLLSNKDPSRKFPKESRKLRKPQVLVKSPGFSKIVFVTFLDFSVRVGPLIEVKKKKKRGKGNAKPCGFYTHYYLSSNYNNIYNNYVLYCCS